MSKRQASKKNNDHEVIDKLTATAKEVKEKYDKMDDKTKKKVMAAMSGALALLLAISIGKKIKKHQRE